MEHYILDNGIKISVKVNKNTPRAAVVMYAGINEEAEITGLYYLMSQLFLQGTKNRTSEELASEMDENALDISIEKKADYITFKLYCLNEDIEHGLELMQDIIENSDFKNYEKEILKIKGEFEADLDSAKIQAQDNYYRTVFPNHHYGAGRKEIMDSLSSITKKDLLKAFDKIKYKTAKNISVSGDIEPERLKNMLQKYFGALKISSSENTVKEVQPLDGNKISVIAKSDANQAQIFKGWVIPSIYSSDYPVFIVLNSILGASGLSSRLFLELREKQGLAYNVRSVYEPYTAGGNFFVYIAADPDNIRISLEGFEKEINKIMTEKVSSDELENAKNNAVGRRQFYYETNLQEASLNGYYEFTGLESGFEDKLEAEIKKITPEIILDTAQRYFSRSYALSVLAPENKLKAAGLL